jgi:hypothetical protein
MLSMIMTAVLLLLAVMAKALPCRIPYGFSNQVQLAREAFLEAERM